MEPIDLELYIQRLRFENECLRRRGTAFQGFFEQIMSKSDPSFVTIKPWGREGDRKCDGISESSGAYYQVYAPDELNAAQTINKIDEDFEGAKRQWSRLQKWVFVWSAVPEGLPPAVA